MSWEQVLDFLLNITPLMVAKFFLVAVLLFYVVFAWVVWRQQRFMSQVVEVSISPFLAILAQIHFWASVALFIFALFVL